MNRIERLLQRWRVSQAIPWVPEGARVLDVGCFDETLFRCLGDRLVYGVGVDPLLDQAVEGARFSLVPGALPQDRPDGEQFDVIVMLAVLEHVARERIEECARTREDLLVPDGLAVATVPAPVVGVILDVSIRRWKRSQLGLNNLFVSRRSPRIDGRNGERRPANDAG